ncbi:hypothetical protein RAS12_22965 [Achromobacter seleniivolatilans]|uniref:Lipoprotein n=1 Tax=Achromobacter seleniivolatilans TaxID=3047478 RepID=A0ABY9LYD7_9BURK|nr:hypothetical protein [Achromobacter sp. R39]WMD19455.1 hypothetical protein RAS12_22965 [Achromobacter sp. R39]
MHPLNLLGSTTFLLLTSGCAFIMGSPPNALATNPAPQEVITPVVIYTSDCDFKKKIDGTGWIGASTALPAAYAGEAVCKALNAELPGAMDAAGIKATFKQRKVDPQSARPTSMKEDAVAVGAKYAVVVDEPSGFEGYQQYGPSVGTYVRLYDAESGEYRARADTTYPISLRDFNDRGPSAEGRRIGADIANRLARTMRERCIEPYPYQCGKTGLFRFAVPSDTYGK